MWNQVSALHDVAEKLQCERDTARGGLIRVADMLLNNSEITSEDIRWMLIEIRQALDESNG